MIRECAFSLPAVAYYLVQKTREKAYEYGRLQAQSVTAPVISIGNIVMGGSGKTPMTLFLANKLSERGHKPAIVSRGYKGTNAAPSLIVGMGDGKGPLVPPEVCGDESYLMAASATHIPVIVGAKRINPCRTAIELSANVILLDDGFQHMQLQRDVNIVMISGAEDRMFPLGRLREPLSALKRADRVLAPVPSRIPARLQRYLADKPVFGYCVLPESLLGVNGAEAPAVLAGRDVTLFSGVARPERFRATVERLGARVVEHRIFPDHHVFTATELENLVQSAGGAELVCTEKDWVKLTRAFTERSNVKALRITVSVNDEDAFVSAIEALIRKKTT